MEKIIQSILIKSILVLLFSNLFLSVRTNACPLKLKQTVNKAGSDSSINGEKKKNNSPEYPTLYADLMTSQGNNYYLIDGVATSFGNKFSADVDGDDAAKLWNFNENIAIRRDSKYLAIEFRPIPKLSDTLFYTLYLRQQPYTLKFFVQNLNKLPYMRAWLVDKYLNTKTEIKLTDTMYHSFMPNPDTNSYRNRFMIVLDRQRQVNAIPVTITTNQLNSNSSGLSANAFNNVKASIYPNPVNQGGKVFLRFDNTNAKENYTAILYNEKGVQVMRFNADNSSSVNIKTFTTGKNLKPGIYTLQLIANSSKEQAKYSLLITQ